MMPKLISGLRRLWQLLSVSDEGLAVEEVAFLRRWDAEKTWIFLRYSHRVLSYVLPVSTIFIYLLSPFPQRYAQIPTHLIMSFFAIYFAVRADALKHATRMMTLIIPATALVGYALAIALAFHSVTTVNSVIFLTSIFVAIAILSIISYPFSNASILLYVGFQYTIGLWAFTREPSIGLPAVATFLGLLMALATWFYYARRYRVRRQALTEYTVRRLLIEREHAPSADIEKDIKTAQALQSGHEPLHETPAITGLTIQIIHHRVETLASAWCAVRHLPNGASAVFMADATRQGVQAGLMIHSLQALWVLSLTATCFDAAKWLNTANRSLSMITHPRPHDVTMRLVELFDDHLLYYAPSDMPIWLVEQTPDATNTRAFPVKTDRSSGENMVVQRTLWNFESNNHRTLLMSTREENLTGLLKSEQNVLDLTDRLQQKKESVFDQEEHTSSHQADRLIVWMNYAA